MLTKASVAQQQLHASASSQIPDSACAICSSSDTDLPMPVNGHAVDGTSVARQHIQTLAILLQGKLH